MWRKNNSAFWIFAVVQAIVLLCLFFEVEIEKVTGSVLGQSPNAENLNTYAILIILLALLVTATLLRGNFTLKNDLIEFKFPLKLHLTLLFIEVIYTLYIGQGGDTVEEVRNGVQSGEFKIWAPLKLTTVSLYMTTMILFAKIFNQGALQSRIDEAGPQRYLLWLTAFMTVFIFLFKDITLGSRGSFLNILAFSVGGITYVRAIQAKSLIKITIKILPLIFILTWVIFILTVNRAGDGGLAIIRDNLIVKFSSNIAIIHDLLIDSLKYRVGTGDDVYVTSWINLRFAGSDDLEFSFFHFVPTITSFVNQHMLLDQQYKLGSLYFNIHGDYPFNSVNFLLLPFVYGFYGIFLIISILVAMKYLSRKAPWLSFYIHCMLIYFSFLSFTTLSLIEIPFLFIPVFGYFFKKNIIIVGNKN